MYVEAKIIFLDFLEFKALRAKKNYITFHIYLRAIYGRKERKIDSSTSAAKFKFYSFALTLLERICNGKLCNRSVNFRLVEIDEILSQLSFECNRA